jgi:hypothetical protein
MKVVAFHTGGPYREEADRLKKSLLKVGMDNFLIQEIPLNCDWHHAVSMKPIFLNEVRNRYPGGLLYIDVDAVVHENCSEYFDSLEGTCDFAAHWFQGPSGGYDRKRNDNHFLSGTMYFADTMEARLLLKAWIVVNKGQQIQGNWKGGGQANLAGLLERRAVSNLRIHKLPGRYCYVFDKSWAYPENEPRIIEHLIASRENKDQSKGKINDPRRRRISEIEEVMK